VGATTLARAMGSVRTVSKTFEIFHWKFTNKVFDIFSEFFGQFCAAVPNQWQAILSIQNALDYSSMCT
jgi:hypothetical protein